MSTKVVDFTTIIPRMRDQINEYISKKAAQGQILTEREAILAWLDRYYDSWLTDQLGLPTQEPAPVSENPGEGFKKRKNRRIPIEISAYYRVLWSPPKTGEKTGEKANENKPADLGDVKNISAGGLYIVTGRSYDISTLMEVEFELPSLPESITAFSMVVWREERPGGRFGHGLHFSHIETGSLDMVNEAIIERLLDAPVVSLNSDDGV